MRRLYHNTTALVTCFALLAGQGTWVQAAWAQPAANPAPVVEEPAASEAPVIPTQAAEPAPAPEAPTAAPEAPSEPVEAPAPASEPPPSRSAREVPAAPEPAPEPEVASPSEPATASPPPAEAPIEQSAAEPTTPTEAPAPEASPESKAATEPAPAPQTPTEAPAATEAPAEAAPTTEPKAPTEAPAPEASPESKAPSEPAAAPQPSTEAPVVTEAPAEAPAPETPTSTPAAEEVPEVGLAPSEEALSAASETSPTSASALEAPPTAAPPEQEITTEAGRSSSTDLAAPLTQQKGPVSTEKAKDDSLAKALLLGAGALAVGAILSNNREVALSTPDRVVLERPDGSYQVLKDEDALLHQSGAKRSTQTFPDGSTRSLVRRPDGSQIVTYRDKDLRLLRRDHIAPDGQVRRLIDETARVEPIDIATLPAPAKPLDVSPLQSDEDTLRRALTQQANAGRHFSLAQIRAIPEVRALVAPISIDTITFNTGSAAIDPDQARSLSSLGRVIQSAIQANPREIFLIEGHTDTTGSAAVNLALSDRRAESLALALTEYFAVPPENLVVQGYGENFLKIRAEGNIRENRRAAVRRITDLLMPTE